MIEYCITTERRKLERLKTFQLGRIVLNGGGAAIDCVIRDLSEAGAQLGIAAHRHLPARFRLHVIRAGTMVTVRFAWRRGDRVGISFDGDMTRAPPVAFGRDAPIAALKSA